MGHVQDMGRPPMRRARGQLEHSLTSSKRNVSSGTDRSRRGGAGAAGGAAARTAWSSSSSRLRWSRFETPISLSRSDAEREQSTLPSTAISRLHLGYISTASRLSLGYISAISRRGSAFPSTAACAKASEYSPIPSAASHAATASAPPTDRAA